MTAPVRTSAAETADWTPDPRRWRALAVCLTAGFMTLLDVSIVNVALPTLRSSLHASSSDVQWVLSGYALTFGLVLVPSGRLGDARGRRRMFVIGLLLFLVSSAAAGFAPNPTTLTVSRLVQGAAGGIINPQVAGIIQQLFRGQERGRAFGLLGATIGISTAVGPLAGGLLIAAAGPQNGWRWVFFVNLPIGLAVLPLAFRWIPPLEHHGEAARTTARDLDLVGVGLLGLGVVLVLLPLVQEQQWQGDAKWLLLPAAAVVLAAFVLWERATERRGRPPLVALPLFRLPSYSFGATIALLYFAGFTAIFFIFTLYLQAGLHYSALLAGAAITPFALGSAVTSAVGGRVVHRFGRPLVTAGLVLVVVGLAITDVAVRWHPGREVGWYTALPLLVAGMGSGLVISPNQAISLSEVPPRVGGAAAAVLQTGQRVGTAAGIAAVGSAFFAALTASHGSWADAYRHGLLVAIAITALALVTGVLDWVWTRLGSPGGGRHRLDHTEPQLTGTRRA